MENFLLTTDGELKLCDFGSATTETYAPDVSWSAQQRDMLEDQVSRTEQVKIFLLEFNSLKLKILIILINSVSSWRASQHQCIDVQNN